MTDLRTTYLGLRLHSPLVASASPLTGHLDSLLALQEAGAAAVVLPSLFQEEVENDSLQLHERLETGALSFPEATDFFPELEFGDVGPWGHVKLTSAAKDMLRIPVIASINGTTPGGWVYYAQAMEQAGADAIELNLYAVAADSTRSGADVEAGYLEVVRRVRAAVDIPLAVKLSPFFSSTAHFARRVAETGADGLVLFNRFYQPDIDLDTLDVLPRVALSDPRELRLPLRWLAILRPQLTTTSLASRPSWSAGWPSTSTPPSLSSGAASATGAPPTPPASNVRTTCAHWRRTDPPRRSPNRSDARHTDARTPGDRPQQRDMGTSLSVPEGRLPRR